MPNILFTLDIGKDLPISAKHFQLWQSTNVLESHLIDSTWYYSTNNHISNFWLFSSLSKQQRVFSRYKGFWIDEIHHWDIKDGHWPRIKDFEIIEVHYQDIKKNTRIKDFFVHDQGTWIKNWEKNSLI